MKKWISIILSVTMLTALIPTMAFAKDDKKFTDVDGNEYYSTAADALAELDILAGYEDGSFGAERDVTRAEMAAITCRMLGMEDDADKASGKTEFDDVKADHWASGYINIATDEGIIEGDGDGNFRPEDNVKYEEAIKMVVCAMGLGDDIEVDPKDWSKGYLSVAEDNKITNDLRGSKGKASTRGDIAVMVYNGLIKDLTAPVASKAEGTYSGTQKIELTTSTKDATIYYTTDGSAPTTKSSKYTKAISISKTSTLRAIAVLNGILASDELKAVYTIKYSGGGGGGGGGGSSSSQKYTVSFNLNYDGATGAPASQSIKNGDKATEPDIPERDGYMFIGWSTDKEEGKIFDFSYPINKNTILYAQWYVDKFDETDTDGDGLIDIYEDMYKTDKTLKDTDGDSLSDYEEIIIGTDPLIPNAIPDDTDGDGLKDLDELRIYLTDSTSADTDNDGLTDYDEVIIHGTNPNQKDTDGDGLDDAFEVQHGLNPNSLSTDGITPDSEVKLQQYSDESCISIDLINEDNVAVPSVSGITNGQLVNNIFITSATDSTLNENRATVGKPIIIDADNEYLEGLTLEFELKKYCDMGGTIDYLTICNMNEDGDYNLLETNIESNAISCTLSGAGTYLVMDLDLFLNNMGINIDDYDKMKLLDVSATENGLGLMLSSDPVVSLLSSDYDINGQADIVFAIDTTGSMGDEIAGVVSNVTNFAESLARDYNVRANYALIDFKDLAEDGDNTTRVIKNGSSNWFTNVNSFAEHVNYLIADGGGDDPECSIDALETARRLDFRKGASKFIILITDAEYKVLNKYGISSFEEEVKLLKQDGIITSVVTSSSLKSIYQDLVASTGGVFADITNNFSTVLLQLANSVGEETSSGTWAILKHGYRYVNLPQESDGDYDKDGLSDTYELGKKETIDLSMFIKARLAMSGVPFELYHGKTTIEVYDAKSDPTTNDTDGDGIYDNEDTAPWNKGLANGIYGKLNLVTCYGDGWTSGHSFFVYQSYVNDSINFSGLINGWQRTDLTGGWNISNIKRDTPPTNKYSIIPKEYVSIGNGALGGGPSSGASDGSSDGSVAGDANGVNYNMEVYKFIAAGRPTGAGVPFSYLSNTYISEEITYASLEKLISYLSRDDVNYWSAMHNCAKVAVDGWNQISTTKVSAYGLAGWHIAPTPSALRDNLRKIDGCQENFRLSEAFKN